MLTVEPKGGNGSDRQAQRDKHVASKGSFIRIRNAVPIHPNKIDHNHGHEPAVGIEIIVQSILREVTEGEKEGRGEGRG
jgi:hypothetical protein